MHPELHLGSWFFSTYFFIISLDFCLMLFWLRSRSQKLGLPVKLSLDIGIISSIAGLIGSRLFHVFYEFPEFYFAHPINIFMLWQGGYVFLAGVFTGISVGILLLRFHKQKIYPWLDLFAPIIALGYSIGRWACFFQGCCYGRETDSFLGVHFEGLAQAGETFARYPTQLFASLGELVVFSGLMLLEKFKSRTLIAGQIFAVWLIGHGLNRLIMELLRDDPRGPLLVGLGVSFWIAIGLAGIGLTIFRYLQLGFILNKKRVL